MADGSIIIDASLDDAKVRGGLGKLGSVAGAALGGVAKAAGAMAAAMGTAALAGAAALGKAVLSSYADYEQLVGGVDTLFKGSSAQLQQYAANAYKTAGMSANEYMSTVTSFSASLISSLGGDTEKATAYADRAVTDMADNANKMGTSIESIQQTYQSLARGNYAMLDNLKLGYGGTKEELQRLLDDAEKLPEAMGKDFDINNFADVTEAIHLVQVEMGIAGATAAEAEGTISGSVATMGAAWQNFLTGLGDSNADMEGLAGNLSKAFQNVVKNVTPVLEQLVKALPEAFGALAPAIVGMLPSLITAATGLFTGALNALVTMIPQLIPVAVTAIMTIVQGLIDNLPLIMEGALQIIMALTTGLLEMLPELSLAAIAIISQLMVSIGEQLPTLIPLMVDVVLTIVEGLIANIDQLVTGAIALMNGLAQGLINALPELVARLPDIIIGLVNGLVANLPLLLNAGVQIIIALAGAIIQSLPQLITRLPEIITAIVDGLSSLLDSLLDVGKNIVEGIWTGISNGFTWIKNKLTEWIGNVVDFIKELFGIASPSKVMRDEIGKWLPPGIAVGFELAVPDTMRKMKRKLGGMMQQMQAVVLGGQNGLRLAYAGASGAQDTTAGGNTYHYTQTVNTHDSYSPYELTQQFQAMKAREGWQIQ